MVPSLRDLQGSTKSSAIIKMVSGERFGHYCAVISALKPCAYERDVSLNSVVRLTIFAVMPSNPLR